LQPYTFTLRKVRSKNEFLNTSEGSAMIENSKIQQLLLMLLIAALMWMIFWNLSAFMPAFLGAYTLYVLLRRPQHYLTDKCKWNKNLSAGVLILLSSVVISLIVTALFQLLSPKVVNGFQNSQQIKEAAEAFILKAETRIGVHLLTQDRIKALSEWGFQEITNVLNATLIGVLQGSIAFFVIWFMLTESKKMETSFFSWLPLKPANIDYFRKELNTLVYSNAIGIPMMGVIQGMAGLLGYWIAGVEEIWFWALVTAFAGMIPFLGVMLAYIPLALILFTKGMTTQAIFILIYGTAVIGTVDNVARMWLLNKIGHTHPLITLFGVIIGLKLFGFVGFIFGPIMIAMCFLLLKIYTKEFKVR
jgi:predicted PurR-regulated permease PerM